MPYNRLLELLVNNNVAEKTAALLKLKKLFFKGNTKYYPVSAKDYSVKQKPLPSLPLCILMDVIGSAVIVIPVLGELIWAPISALIFWRMFGFSKGFLGGIFSFIEELIPGIDFIPTFTIMWFVQYAKRKKENFPVRPFTR
jgi:hypothetical protein